MRVDNLGPDTSTDVVLTNDVPTGLVFDSATPSQGTSSHSGSNVQAMFGTIAAGSSATLTIETHTTAEGGFTDLASVSSSMADPVAVNDTAAITHYVALSAPLIVGVNDPATPVFALNPVNGLAVPLFSGISVGGLAADDAFTGASYRPRADAARGAAAHRAFRKGTE